MNEIWKLVLSLSFSGTAVIAALLLFCRIFQKRLSKSWQYYIWLIAVARLLVPFSGTVNLTGHAFAQLESYRRQGAVSAETVQDTDQEPMPRSGKTQAAERQKAADEPPFSHPEDAGRNAVGTDAAEDGPYFGEEKSSAAEKMGILWLLMASVLLLRKILLYRSFVRHIRAGSEPAKLELLEQFGRIAEEMHPGRTVELRINCQIPSPLLTGFIHPMVILPSEDLSDEDFHYTVLHELTHCCRMDILYKWLVQLTICLHWFNPFVRLLGREVDRACELACDEAVLEKLNADEKRAYGDTLLHAAEQNRPWRCNAGAVTLHESGKRLKERLEAIMEHRKRSVFVKVLSLVLAAAATAGAAVLGVYAGPQKRPSASVREEKTAYSSGGREEEPVPETAKELQTREWSLPQSEMFDGNYYQSAYYEAPYLFYIGYDLTEEGVKQYAGTELVLEDGERLYVSFSDSAVSWMEDEAFLKVLSVSFSEFRSRDGSRISGIRHPVISSVEAVGYDVEGLTAKYYAEDDMGYFSVMIGELSADRQQEYLELAYQENNAAVFSVVLGCLYCDEYLTENLIDSWVSRAYEDGDIASFAILTGYLSEKAQQEWYTRLTQEQGRNRNFSFAAILRELLYGEEEWDWEEEVMEAR